MIMNPLYMGVGPQNPSPMAFNPLFAQGGGNRAVYNALYCNGSASNVVHSHPEPAGPDYGRQWPPVRTSTYTVGQKGMEAITARLRHLTLEEPKPSPKKSKKSKKSGRTPFIQHLPEGISVQALEPGRFEENLCLLLQDFEKKARYEFLHTHHWPRWEEETAALSLSEALDGVEWRNVKHRDGYLDEIDFIWRANVNMGNYSDPVFQLIWEFVAGMIRVWAQKLRHPWCYPKGPKGEFRLQRAPSLKMKFRFLDAEPPKSRGFIRRW